MNAPFAIDRPDVIHEAVCETLCGVFPTISREALLASGKINHTTAWVRQVGMYVMAGRLHVSQAKTAQHFGRDRTTVLHAVQLATQEAEARPATAAFFDFLEQQAIAALNERAATESEWGMI